MDGVDIKLKSTELLQIRWLVENDIRELEKELDYKIMGNVEEDSMTIKIIKTRIERNGNILEKISKAMED